MGCCEEGLCGPRAGQTLKTHQQKIALLVPSSVALVPPLEITSAASGATLTAFREVMHYDHLLRSLSQTAQCEAAGTIWMLGAISHARCDAISISQLEGALWTCSEEAFLLSFSHPPSRRYSFDVPLPA